MKDRINFAPCGYLLLTKQGIVKKVNQTLLNMLGYKYEDLIDKHIESMLSNANKFIFHTYFFPYLQLNGYVEEMYLTLKAKEGANLPVLFNGSYSVCDGVELIDCIIVKMTKRIDYEKELQQIKKELVEAFKLKDEALEQQSRQRELFETTLLSINEGIIVTDRVGKITLMNRRAETYTGWSTEEAYGKKIDEVFTYINFKTGEKGIDPIQCVLETGKTCDLIQNIKMVAKDRSERYISGIAAGILTEHGEITGVVVSFKDITKEYIQEREIEGFLNVNLDILCVADTNGNFHKVNKKFEDILGYGVEEMVNKSYLSLVHEEDIPETLNIVQDLINQKSIIGFTNRVRCKDGSYKYIEWHTEPNGKYTYSSARDVTEKRELEIKLSQANHELLQITEEMKIKNELLGVLAVTDELTGAFNRHFFDQKSSEEMKKSDRYDQPLSMIIMDLDHFKRVNDTWGHPIGDEVLRQIAKITHKNIRNSDILVRLGGEEFIVLMPKTSMSKAFAVAEKVREKIEQNQIPIVGKVTASFGVAQRMKYESFESWYKRMDQALYQAKEGGRNCVVAATE